MLCSEVALKLLKDSTETSARYITKSPPFVLVALWAASWVASQFIAPQMGPTHQPPTPAGWGHTLLLGHKKKASLLAFLTFKISLISLSIGMLLHPFFDLCFIE